MAQPAWGTLLMGATRLSAPGAPGLSAILLRHGACTLGLQQGPTTLVNPQLQHQHTRHMHSQPPVDPTAAAGSLPPVDAASSAEALMYVLSPAQLGTQALHSLHAASGLPWWASIPLTALAAKAVLLPLSLRAKASSANFPLFNTALSKARVIRSAIAADMTSPSAPSTSMPTLAEPGGDRTESQAGSTTSATAAPPMWTTARMTHKYLREQQKVPGIGWYLWNAAAQVRGLFP